VADAGVLFLVDENVPESIAEFLRVRGHRVLSARDELASGAPDPVIMASADAVGAVVVTWNRKHFKRLAGGAARRYERAGLLCFSCREPDGRSRLEEEIEMIELQIERCGRNGTRIDIEVQRTGLRLGR
jgi:predicted nuclease of predicted toxin-antitoxin system